MRDNDRSGFVLEGALRQGLGDGAHVVGDLLPAIQEDQVDVLAELQVHENLERNGDE